MATTTTKTVCSVSLPKRCKPSKAVEKHRQSKPILGYVNLCRTRHGVELQATDRFIAVRVPLKVHEGSSEALVEGPLSTEAMLQLEKGSPGPITFSATRTTVKVGDEARRIRPPSDPFPNLEQVQPAEPAQPFRVALNTVLLRKLAQAIGSDAVVLEFDQRYMDDADSYLRAIAVRPAEDPAAEAHGLIMPIKARNV